MGTKHYTDEELDALRDMPKRVTNPKARWLRKPTMRPVHKQRTYQASSEQDPNSYFTVYQRQNLADKYDFSCGIKYIPRGGSPLTLARYNGPGHVHGDIAYRPHIHCASAQAIANGEKPESNAEETDRFTSLEGALACLMKDFQVSGIHARHDEPTLAL